jgi:glycine/D-amino acid oxidase-like deaminating enzyme
MRSHVDIAIVGGGVFGTSIAAHLARCGHRDVVLIEAHDIGSQTTSQAAGLVPLLRASDHLTEMARYSLAAFETFADDTGHDLRFHQVGSLKLALNAARAAELRQQVQRARRLRVPLELIDVQAARRHMPVLDLEGVQAVSYAPRDGYIAQPAAIAVGYAALASRLGVEVLTGTRVLRLRVDAGRIRGLETSQGPVEANRVILAAGAWTPALTRLTGITIPTVAVRHQLQVTGPLPGVHPTQPVVRIPDCSAYLRPEGQGLIVGAFEAQPRSFGPEEVAAEMRSGDLEPDRDSLRRYAERVMPYVPALSGATIIRTQQGLPTFTPDGSPLIGAVPGIESLFAACGCCATGISLAPAVGRIVAEWLSAGSTFVEMAPFALSRFGMPMPDPSQLRRACESVYAHYYALGEGKI